MTDTTIKKVEAGSSPKGEMGQKYLVAGKRVSMRLWIDEPGGRPRLKSTFGAASFLKLATSDITCSFAPLYPYRGGPKE
jgi:hypothetical protein